MFELKLKLAQAIIKRERQHARELNPALGITSRVRTTVELLRPVAASVYFRDGMSVKVRGREEPIPICDAVAAGLVGSGVSLEKRD